MKTLIAYYSRKDENYINGTLKYIDKGNTEVIADYIHSLIGGDMFKIEQRVPYSPIYNECIEQARIDKLNKNKPELASYLDDISSYGEIYLGFPNYWGSFPMAVASFLSRHDLSNKIIHPFITHEGSGVGHSIVDLGYLLPFSNIKEALAIYGHKVNASRKEVEEWLHK